MRGRMAGAIVHEWVAESGGSENVFQAMAEAFPDADLHCLWNDTPSRFDSRAVYETWMARTAFRGHKALALPLMPWTWRQIKSQDRYDWMLVSSHLFAHHARFRDQREIPKYVYAHTPARYIWTPDLDKRGGSSLIRALASVLKPVDAKRAQEPVAIAANSKFIQDRIAQTWGRESDVIYPPVEVSRIQASADWSAGLGSDERRIVEGLPEVFVLGASRFVPYKELDRVIDAGQAIGLPVVLAGSGPEECRLRSLASGSGIPVTFVTNPSNALLYALYQRCAVFVFPPIEDFGIMPVEAMAAGASVLANRIGGASESVVEGKTGALADFSDPADLKRAALAAIGLSTNVSAIEARNFSRERFDYEIQSWVGVDGSSNGTIPWQGE